MIRARMTRWSLIALAAWAVAMVAMPGFGQVSTTASTTVILVRHAEKAGPTGDVPLNGAGQERARVLVHVLGELEIDAIYSTPFARTRQTAQPLADAVGLDVTLMDVGATYSRSMAAKIRSEHEGDVVVVVSHSNTVPEIIRELGAGPVPTIEDHEYDDLYVVTLTGDGQAKLLSLRYGRETP
jgi:broad specificity phosphatase PhoE